MNMHAVVAAPQATELPVCVLNMAGEVVGQAHFLSTDRISKVKRCLHELHGISLYRQRLLLGAKVLDDFEVLAWLPQPLVLTLVVLSYTPEAGAQLQDAARSGDLHAALQALRSLADPNHDGDLGVTPLMLSSNSGHLDVVRLLCEAAADVDRATRTGATAIFFASQNGHAKVVQFLCRGTIDFDRAMLTGATPLCVAAHGGHLESVRLLLEARADKDRAKLDGSTPLYLAAHNGHSEIVKLLVEANADPQRPNLDGSAPINAAVRHGHQETATVLRLAGAGSTGHGPQPLPSSVTAHWPII